MQVANRRRRGLGTRYNDRTRTGVEQGTGAKGSRFEVLRDEPVVELGPERHHEVVDVQNLDAGTTKDMNGTGRRKGKLVLTNAKGSGTSSARHEQVIIEKPRRTMTCHMDLGENTNIFDGGALNNVAAIQGRDVASDEVFFVAETTLNNEKHKTLRVGEEASVKMTKSKHGRVLPTSVRGNTPKPSTKAITILKNDPRHNLKVKRKDDRGQGRTTLASRVSKLTFELDNAHQFGETRDRNLQHLGDYASGVKIWRSIVLGVIELRIVYACTTTENPTLVVVGNIVNDSGSWDWSRLTPWLASETLEKIAATIPPRFGIGADVPGWR
ncbi:hypothetical protein V6N12_074564 [Hibiscus sabdariffa]|uniref:Uncharacterized protein n=1 Tax=Hibiscus sabdariffa TaxID=183260 RepID=A0ABR2B1S4_9ROSI